MEDLPVIVPRRRTSYAHSALGADMDGLESTIHLLDYELYVASIPKDCLASATHALLKILLKLFGTKVDYRRYVHVHKSCLLYMAT